MHLKFSQEIESLLKKSGESPLTLEEILRETSERGISLTIGLLTLPFLFPMPPGLSIPLGLGCLFLASQMALGRRSPWLPKRIAQLKFTRSFSIILLKRLNNLTKFLEKFVRPRWFEIAENPSVWKINGYCIAWLTILLMLPIPLTNPIPSISILTLVIATLESDGLLMCVGYGFTLINTLLFSFLVYTIYQASNF